MGLIRWVGKHPTSHGKARTPVAPQWEGRAPSRPLMTDRTKPVPLPDAIDAFNFRINKNPKRATLTPEPKIQNEKPSPCKVPFQLSAQHKTYGSSTIARVNPYYLPISGPVHTPCACRIEIRSVPNAPTQDVIQRKPPNPLGENNVESAKLQTSTHVNEVKSDR